MAPSTRDFDRILKENLKEVAEAVLRKIVGIEVISVETLDTKLPITDEREADFILNVKDNKNQNFIVHLELQSTNADNMLYRMLRYYTYIRQTYNLSVRQYVIYIGRAPMNMENLLFDTDINYRYNLIDMRNIHYKQFLQSDKPEEVILAILCDFQDRSPRESVHEILRRLKMLVKQDELKKGKYIRQLEVLSQLRNLEELIIEEEQKMAIIYDIEKDVRYKEGIEKGLKKGLTQGKKQGILEGKREGLLEGIEALLNVKFGAQGLKLLNSIKKIEDIKPLQKVKEKITTASELREVEEFVEKII